MGVTAPSKCVYPGKASPTRPRDKSRLHPTLQRPSPLKRLERFRSRIFLLGAAGEQEENGLGASASGPARTLTQNVPLGSRVVSRKVNFLGQGNKGGSSRLPLGEERANILLLACCYQEGSNPGLVLQRGPRFQDHRYIHNTGSGPWRVGAELSLRC